MPVVYLLLFLTDLEIFVIITTCLTGLFLATAELNKREINNFNLFIILTCELQNIPYNPAWIT